MGGSAFMIPGMLAEYRLEPTPIERTLADRILGRQRFRKPNVVDLGGGRRYIDFPAEQYQTLAKDFRDFLRRRIAAPWLSTQVFFDYLKDQVMSVYLRGEQGPERTVPDFHLQLTFSGCAGLAETSAELGTHWAWIYYTQENERIKEEHLYHLGFAPDDSKIETYPGRFFPVGRLGYALHVGAGRGEIDPTWEGSREFELDSAIVDQLYQQGQLSLLRGLDARFGPVMADGKCRCQLCMPEFDASDLNEFGIV